MAIERGKRHRCIVDDSINNHRGDITFHWDFIGCYFGDLPGELLLAGQIGFRRIDPDFVQLHAVPPVDGPNAGS
jgi:hypothetical protein